VSGIGPPRLSTIQSSKQFYIGPTAAARGTYSPAEGQADTARFVATFPSFRDYTEAVLYSKNWGFYTSGKIQFGFDFGTLPIALSPIFGEMVATRIFQLWEQMRNDGELDSGERFTIVEFGAGGGVLARDILRAIRERATTDDQWQQLLGQLSYIIGDKNISEELTSLIEELRKELKDSGALIQVDKMDARDSPTAFQAGSLKGIILSNELPDNFPTYKVRFENDLPPETAIVVPKLKMADGTLAVLRQIPDFDTESLLRESRDLTRSFGLEDGEAIYLTGDRFTDLMDKVARSGESSLIVTIDELLKFEEYYVPVDHFPDLSAHFSSNPHIRTALEANPGKRILHISPESSQYIRDASSLLESGYLFTIDYGFDFETLLRTIQSNLRTYQMEVSGQTAKGVAGLDPYHQPGFTDITTHQDFTALIHAGKEADLDLVFYGDVKELETQSGISLRDQESQNRMRANIPKQFRGRSAQHLAYWTDRFYTGMQKVLIQHKKGNQEMPIARSSKKIDTSTGGKIPALRFLGVYQELGEQILFVPLALGLTLTPVGGWGIPLAFLGFVAAHFIPSKHPRPPPLHYATVALMNVIVIAVLYAFIGGFDIGLAWKAALLLVSSLPSTTLFHYWLNAFFHRRRVRKYLRQEGLDPREYKHLIKSFTPEIMEVLLDDPALRPTFLLALPEEHLGPLEGTDPEKLKTIGGGRSS